MSNQVTIRVDRHQASGWLLERYHTAPPPVEVSTCPLVRSVQARLNGWGEGRLLVTDDADSDAVAGWIDGLRERLERGDLASLAPIDLGDGVLASGELTIRVMLADLDHLDWLAFDAPDSPRLADRRRWLVDDFRRLRAQIG